MGNVEILLLDEPFEGLAPSVVDSVRKIIEEIKGETTILLVEQNASLALALANRAYVLNNGIIEYAGLAGDCSAIVLCGSACWGSEGSGRIVRFPGDEGWGISNSNKANILTGAYGTVPAGPAISARWNWGPDPPG